MALATRFEDLQVWQAARRLTAQVYALAVTDPLRRNFGLVDQMRRAAMSSMNNIAEGFDSASRSSSRAPPLCSVQRRRFRAVSTFA